MSRKDIEAIYPLSPMQQGMLFHTVYAPNSGAYVYQLSCKLYEPLNIPAFMQAWQKVIDRHSILRTFFVWERRDKPLQVVRRQVKLNLEQHDWRQLEQGEQQQQLQAFLTADRQRGFDLSATPLLRQALIRISDEAFYFISTRPQLVQDGWSGPLILKEVFAYYEALSRGQDLHLDPPRPFRDYISWLQQQDLAQAEAFWRKTLKGFTAPTPLPDAGSGRIAETGQPRFAEQLRRLSVDATERLQRFAAAHELTVNTLVQGAWALLLSRYSGERDVVFGVVVSGRPAELSGSEKMVGLFINTLPLRVQIDGEAVAVDWLKKIQTGQLEARQFEYTPLVEVQGWSEVRRGVGLFESLLVFENYPVQPQARGQNTGLQIQDVHSVEQTNYPLTLMAGAGPQLSFRLIYDVTRFDAAIIERMQSHTETLLTGLAVNPRSRLSDIPLLSAAERQLILFEWNRTAQDYPEQKCIHELFEAQSERTPDAVAVVDDQEQVSYGELNRRANQLAHYLRQFGVGPEVLVGLLVERSVRMVVGLLGILKAGGSYVPLDAAYPSKRLALMLEDAQVRLLLTEEKLIEVLPEHHAKVVRLDADGEAIARESVENPVRVTGPANTAYVIYTSGSTGKPKGVQIPHRAVVNFLTSMSKQPGLTERDTFLAVTTLSFDIAGLEIYLPLMVGARLIIASHEETADGALLSKKMKEHAVSAMQATPATWQMLIEAKWLGDPRLKVICGGEALPWLLATQLRQRSGSLWNMYGPTETTIWSALSVVELSDALVTIGRPIGNTQIYLLDRELQPVACGVAGELYIGGAGLAHGYLNLPALTAEKFVPDPFATQAGARLYRTGDLARHLDDGRIEFLGRIDQQVKVRGYRIELGEIETGLMRHPAVRSAVVVTREDVAGDKRLVAYLVLDGAPPAGGWRSFLKDTLPDYMIPQAYVLLESLPLTPNGKVDRRSLPAPEYTGAEAEGSYTAAGNAIEEMIAGIWCEVLRVERVGPLDSFFELGGHSLLAMQVVSRVREALQCEVPVRLLFETPILREFAASIEASRLTEQGLQAPPIQSVSRDVALPLSFAQQRLWLLNQLEPESPAYNIPIAVRLSGELNVTALERTLGEIIKRHEVLRTTFSVKDGTPVQVIGPATPFRLPLIDLSTWFEVEREQETLVLAAREAVRPFDLEQGPLLRATLLKLSEHEHVALFTMHHIVSDGWSMTVLIREVTILYEAFVRDQSSPLADLNIQYADYSAWQHDYLRGDVLEMYLRYWRKQLASAPALLELPTDHPRPPSQTLHGATHSIILPTRTAAEIKRLSRAEGATLFMTLLAAFQTLLHRWTGQDDIVVGSDIANRSKLETEGLIGCFFNFLTLRTDLSGNPTFRQLLGRVREITLGAYTHQDLPFEMLIEELKPARDPSYSPLFQVLFDFQSVAQQPSPELPGLTLSVLPLPGTVAKFDLSLFVVEREEQLSCTLEYNTDLFEPSTIERLLTSFDTLLDEIVKNPDVAIQRIAMPTEQESRQLIHAFNDDLG